MSGSVVRTASSFRAECNDCNEFPNLRGGLVQILKSSCPRGVQLRKVLCLSRRSLVSICLLLIARDLSRDIYSQAKLGQSLEIVFSSLLS